MSDPARMLDRLAIRELSDMFGHALDHGDCEAFLAIFTEDVRYRNGSRVLDGHPALRSFFETRAKTARVSRHFHSGPRILFEGDGATGTSLWITFAGEGPTPIEASVPYAVSDVSDVYVKRAGCWKIAARTIIQVFINRDIAAPVAAAGGSA